MVEKVEMIVVVRIIWDHKNGAFEQGCVDFYIYCESFFVFVFLWDTDSNYFF